MILLTQDRDFGELVIRRKQPFAGVVVLQIARLKLHRQAERAAQCVATKKDELIGKLTVIGPARRAFEEAHKGSAFRS